MDSSFRLSSSAESMGPVLENGEKRPNKALPAGLTGKGRPGVGKELKQVH
jgi:hypothetical protein